VVNIPPPINKYIYNIYTHSISFASIFAHHFHPSPNHHPKNHRGPESNGIFRALDRDRDGLLSPAEFLEAMGWKKQPYGFFGKMVGKM